MRNSYQKKNTTNSLKNYPRFTPTNPRDYIMKYREDEILLAITKYIEDTYTEHYSTTEEGMQVLDIFRNMGIDKDFCQANAIKYLMRYGKKQGKNQKDLIKAIHYIVLLISSEDKDKPNVNTGTL